MIERYQTPEMSIVWSEAQKYRTWLEVGLKALEAQCELGLISGDLVAPLRQQSNDKPLDEAFANQVLQLESQHNNEMQAFLLALEQRFGPNVRTLGHGLTPTDIADTALGLVLKLALEIVLRDLRELREVVRSMAIKFKHTPCIARTHGIHAEATSFGLKCLNWFAQLGRDLERIHHAKTSISVAMLSGVVGTYSQLDPQVEILTAKKLGLTPDPISAQAIARDRHAQVVAALAQLGGSLERIALELRHLAQTEVGELSEPSLNPNRAPSVRSETISGLARMLRSHLHASLETVAVWGESDLTNSSVERLILPDNTTLASFMLRRCKHLLEHIAVYPERMWHNLEHQGGTAFATHVAILLKQHGLNQAHIENLIERTMTKARETGQGFRELLEADSENTLSKAELDQAFDLKWFLREVDTIFARFGM